MHIVPNPNPATNIPASSVGTQWAWLANELPSAATAAAINMQRRTPYLSIRAPPMVARIAAGTENRAMASPICARLVASTPSSVSMNGTMTPIVIMDSTAGI
jgi:hypothetical protein